MSEYHYSYEHQVIIERIRPDVVEDFLDYQRYHEWQHNLDHVELLEGSWKEEGHLVALVFNTADGNLMRMNERLLEVNLPHKVIVEYQVGTTRNVQHNYFESFGAKTMWTVHTEFYFEQQPPADEDAFKRTTKQGLLAFKRYVETR